MAIVIDDIIKLWKLAKAAYSLNKLSDSPIARALGLSNRVDQLIQEYRAKVSPAREKDMKRELADIKVELERMLTVVLSVPSVDGANKAIIKGSEMLATIQAAEFARLELLRIYWEQEFKRLPQDDPKRRQPGSPGNRLRPAEKKFVRRADRLLRGSWHSRCATRWSPVQDRRSCSAPTNARRDL